MLRRFDQDSAGFGIDCTGFWGTQEQTSSPGKFSQQDNGTDGGGEYNDVWEKMWKHLDKAKSAHRDDKVMYFTNMARNNTWGSPDDYARNLNGRLMVHLAQDYNDIDPNNQRFGVIVIDYLALQHALRIVSKDYSQKWFWKTTFPKSATPFVQFSDGRKFLFQEDGNFVIYDGQTPVFTPHTDNKGAFEMAWQQDGNLVIYRGPGRIPAWATATQG